MLNALLTIMNNVLFLIVFFLPASPSFSIVFYVLQQFEPLFYVFYIFLTFLCRNYHRAMFYPPIFGLVARTGSQVNRQILVILLVVNSPSVHIS